MLKLIQIKQSYPESLWSHERFILREYLQYKILEIVFESKFESKLSFLGGTNLRIVHENQRFSEDLDFDNFNLSMSEFSKLTEIIKRKLELLGLKVEMRNIEKGAYHCYIKFPNLLQSEGLSGHPEEKVLIRIDSQAQHFSFEPEKPILNKFDVFTRINATPPNIILAQKFYAVLNRKRNKGRDFFDIVFILGLGYKPNYEYLELKLGITTGKQLKEAIHKKCREINMQEMADDVSPFLFNPGDINKVLLFPDYIAQVELFI